MTTPTQSNDEWHKQLKDLFFRPVHIDHQNVTPDSITILNNGKDYYIAEIEKIIKQALYSLISEAVVGGYKKGYIQAAVDTIDKVFEMSPKQSFVNWKPTDAFRFYERLKAYEKELQQLNKGDNHD